MFSKNFLYNVATSIFCYFFEICFQLDFCLFIMYILFFLILIIYLFIYLFLAVLGLRFYARAFSSCGKQGPLFIAMRGPLTITASPVAEHRLQTRRLSNCGSRAQSLRGMWDPPRPGPKPVSPALAGRFSTTAPPGKPHTIFNVRKLWCRLSFSLRTYHSFAGYLACRLNGLSYLKETTLNIQIGRSTVSEVVNNWMIFIVFCDLVLAK